MSRYPRPVRNARIKCISCNAPVVETVDETYYCVDCGSSPIRPADGEGEAESEGENEADIEGESEAEMESGGEVESEAGVESEAEVTAGAEAGD